MADALFMVVFDDEMGVCAPMGLDADCDGALCANSGPVALFTSRADARRAIRISTAYAKLRKEQGLPVNEDFLGALTFVRIVKCERVGGGNG